MGKKTYGQMPGVAVTTSGGSVSDPRIGELKNTPRINLWGHSIVLDSDSGIKCQACDKKEEIPELLSMSSGFREVVYKMYILGKFRKQSCNPDPEDIEDMMDGPDKNVDPITRKNHRVPPSNIHWSGNTTTTSSPQSDTVDMYVPKGQRMVIGGTPYTYHGDGQWMNEDRNIALSTVDLFDKYESEAERHFPPEVVHEKKDALMRRRKAMDQQPLDKVGIGDLQDAGIDPATNQSIGVVDSGSSVTIDGQVDNKTAADLWALASKLSGKKDHFLRR